MIFRRRALTPFALVSLALLAVPSCEEKQQQAKQDAFPRIEFRVDESLLGPVLADSSLRFRIRPPSFFLPMDKAEMERLRQKVRSEQMPDDPFAIELVHALRRAEGGPALLLVSHFVKPPTGGMTAEWCERCLQATRETAGGATVKSDIFLHGDVLVQQSLITTEQMVLVRLILQGTGPEPVRVDMALPRSEYEPAAHAIESCLGSLAFF